MPASSRLIPLLLSPAEGEGWNLKLEQTVKRMYTARIVVLVIALAAGGLAAYLVSGTDNKPAPAAPVAQLPTVDVLVAKSDIGLGQTVKPEDLQWQTWPQQAASSSFIRRSERPDATTQIAGSIARSPFVAGEPIREVKLVKADGSGFMAAILPTGMRAVSTEISAESGAGGFILPNDRVDVLLTQREKNPLHPEQPEVVYSKVILANIRVLAIDQAPKEKDGQTTVLGRTATLELTPEQAALLAASRQAGTLSLALRSIADANAVELDPNELANRRGVSINVVRFGVPSQSTAQK
jgi:pilus assembly protein CpaB